MSWIALKDGKASHFDVGGLGSNTKSPVELNAFLPRGSLLLSFAHRPTDDGDSVRVLRQFSDNPWVSGLDIGIDPDGMVRFQQVQGGRVHAVQLKTGLTSRFDDVTLLYTWDAPARSASLSVEVNEAGLVYHTTVSEPLPLSIRDAMRLNGALEACEGSPDMVFLALADHVMPHGPLPTLSPSTLIPTPRGMIKAVELSRGDLVITSNGRTAQVRSAGSTTLPCRGRFAQMTVRAPFYGAKRDLQAASDQRIILSGSEVEYLFATDRVALRVGDLPAHIAYKSRPPRLLQEYCHIMLDRMASFDVGGLVIEAMDASALARSRDLTRDSLVSDLPKELIPRGQNSDVPILRAFEARTLCHLKAG